MKRLEVLLSGLYLEGISAYQRMGLTTDAFFVNQSDDEGYGEYEINLKTLRMLSSRLRGVGISRNQCLEYAKGDICLLSDDDIVYNDGYEQIILEAFEKIPKADIIIFNIDSENPQRKPYINTKISRVRIYNFLRYGAVRIAFRRDRILDCNISFSEEFGGGALYLAGEDNLFLRHALLKKLAVYTYPASIAKELNRPSTWFLGYDERYYYDKGALLAAAFPIMKYLGAVYYGLRDTNAFSCFKRLRLIMAGVINYEKRISYRQWREVNP